MSGYKVDMDGDYAVVSVIGGGLDGVQSGLVFVYKYDHQANVWSEIKTLAPSIPKEQGRYGFSIAIDDDIIVVGQIGFPLVGLDLGVFQEGDVFVYQKDAGGVDNWGEIQHLTSPDPITGNLYGFTLDVEDDVLIVGQDFGDKVFVYGRDEGGVDNWGLVTEIVESGPSFFGTDINLHQDLVIISSRFNQNKVTLYQKNLGGTDNWGLLTELNPGVNVSPGARFPLVAINEETAIIGVPFDNTVYVYKKDVGGVDNWGLVEEITGVESFGSAVDLDDMHCIVGANTSDVNGTDSGQAFIYDTKPGTQDPIQLVKVLSPASPEDNDFYGASVAIDQDQAMVGATQLNDGLDPLPNSRAFFLGIDEGGTDNWGEIQEVDDTNFSTYARFGLEMDTDDDYMIIAASEEDVNSIERSGSVHIYNRDLGGPDNWGPLKKIVSEEPGPNQLFGRLVRIDGELAAVADIDGVHIFSRNLGGPDNWGFVKEIPQTSTAIDLQADILVIGDEERDRAFIYQKDFCGKDNWGLVTILTDDLAQAYGNSVAVSNDNVFVGDRNSNITNINGGVDDGAVYHYQKDQGGPDNWGLVEIFTGSDPNRFGSGMKAFDDLLVVTSTNADSGGNARTYVFEKEEDTYEEKAILSGGMTFGFTVDITDRYLVSSRPQSGDQEVIVHERNTGGTDNWGLYATISNPDSIFGQVFGLEVTISGNSVFTNDGSGSFGTRSGSVYQLELDKIPFTTEWDIGADDQLVIPISSDGYTFEYTWTLLSDPSIQITGMHTSNDGDFITDFVNAGTYSLQITGRFPHLIGYPVDKLTDVTQWGNIVWGSMRSTFAGWQGTAFSATDRPNLSQVSDFTAVFEGATNFNGDISDWKVGSVSNLSRTFHNAASFAGDISNWNIHLVTNLDSTFHGASAFNSDIGRWITRNVTSMVATFQDATLFNQDISQWDVSNVSGFTSTFENASSFNQPLNLWDVSQSESFDRMFHGCTSFNQELGSWKFSQTATVVDVFDGATGFTCEIWSPTIIGWHVNNLKINDLEIGGPEANYDSLAAVVRVDLLARGWTINGTEVMVDCTELEAKYWTGLVDNDWNTAGNWLPKSVPVDGERIVITEAIHEPIVAISTAQVLTIDMIDGGSMLIESSGLLNVNAGLSADINGITLAGEDVSLVNQGKINIDSTNVALVLSEDNASFDNGGQLIITSSSVGILFRGKDVQFSNTDSIIIEGASRGLHVDVNNISITNSGFISVETATNGIEIEGFNAFLINDGHILLEACTRGLVLESIEGMLRPTLINNSQLEILDVVNNSLFAINAGGNLTNSQCAILTTSNGFGNLKGAIVNEGLLIHLGGGYGHTGSYSDDGFQFDPANNIPDDNTTLLDLPYTMEMFTADVDNDGVTLCEGDVPDDLARTFKSEWNLNTVQPLVITHEVVLGYDYLYCITELGNPANFTCSRNGATATELTFIASNSGLYELTLFGNFPAMKTYDRSLLTDVNQWGAIEWQDMESMFSDWSGSTFTATDVPDLSQVTSLERMFINATNFNGDITTWDISNVTNMESMFRNADAFDQPIGLWDITHVQNMKYMLRETDAFNQDLGQWVFQQSTDLDSILHDATGIDCTNLTNTLLGWNFNNPTITDKNLGEADLLEYSLSITSATDDLEDRGWVIPGTGVPSSCGGFTQIYWTGNFNTNWNNIFNWSPVTTPSVGMKVFIPMRPNQPILSTVTPAIESIKIFSGATLTITPPGNLNLED